jgi:hypothetical protein
LANVPGKGRSAIYLEALRLRWMQTSSNASGRQPAQRASGGGVTAAVRIGPGPIALIAFAAGTLGRSRLRCASKRNSRDSSREGAHAINRK